MNAMYMIELTESKVENLAEHLEKGIRYIGKAMQCIDELKSEHGMGNRMGNREPEWEEEEYGDRYGNRMGQRMGQRGGRYSRY